MVVIAEPSGADRGVDAFLSFAGGRARVAVEIKQRANAATAWQLVHEADTRPDTPLLLVADETTAEARAILGELAETGGASPYEFGAVYASLGEINEAFGLLEEAYRQRTPEMMYLGFDWRLLPLHSDPRFGELLRRVGLRPPS